MSFDFIDREEYECNDDELETVRSKINKLENL